MTKFVSGALVALFAGSAAQAQSPEGWLFRFDGAFLHQGDADLSGGSTFGVDRTYLRFGAFNRLPSGLSIGVAASGGRSDYAFSGAAPWGRIKESTVSVTVAGRTDAGARWFVAPSIRMRAEKGASSLDGQSAGLFAGMSWQVNDRLNIGPAFGVFGGLGSDEYDVFPALLLDWQLTDRFSLTTGPTIGASQGPGLSLRYDMSEAWSLTLSARRETNRFALSNTGQTPKGIGEDRSIPVVLSLGYAPNPGMKAIVFAGAELNGQLSVENAVGTTISSQTYSSAPLVGASFSLSF